MTLRFLPQPKLDEWMDQGKVDLLAGKMKDLGGNAEYPVREALHFVKVESGQDAAGLVGKVKSLESLKELQAEVCGTSVLMGETVYEVVPGWLAEETPAAPTKPVPAPVKRFDGKNPEADMLAQLLLDKLS